MTETEEQKAQACRVLRDAVVWNDVEKVRDILGGEVDMRELGVMLYTAADRGYTEIARLLLAKGADVNRAGPTSMTPLMYAASNNYAEMVTLLIESGADVNVKNSWGMTALMYAAENGGGVEAIRVLLDNGAVANLRNTRGDMAFHIAERGCRYERARLLEEALFRQHEESVRREQHAIAAGKQQILKGKARKPAIIRGMLP